MKADRKYNIRATRQNEDVVAAVATQVNLVGCRGFDLWPKAKSLKLIVVAVPSGAQDYGNSTTTGPPMAG